MNATNALVYLLRAQLGLKSLMELMPKSFADTGMRLHNTDVYISSAIDDILQPDSAVKIAWKRIVTFLLKALAEMNKIIDSYEANGLNIEPDAFDNNFYKVITNASNGLYALSGIDTDDVSNEKYTCKVESVRADTVADVMNMLEEKHISTVCKNVEDIRNV